MHRSRFRSATAVIPFVLIFLAACDSTTSPTAPPLAPKTSRSAEPFDNNATLVAVCPTARSYRADGTIGPNGGSISVAGHRLTIPPGVLTTATQFTLHAPAGQEVKLELSANGGEHYRFAAPVVITISYDRCKRQHWPPTPATAWYVENGGTRLVERMAGRDDRRGRAVTFRTNHFSTYLVAY